MADISPQDRDLMIRTIIGESGREPSHGQAAVAHIIMNRAATGQYGGKTPSEVVLARGQFEPWQTRSGELMGIHPNSPIYRNVAGIVDGVLAGQIEDPTGGATHFLNKSVVVGRGGRVPGWAQDQGQQIGNHSFHAPEGYVKMDRPAAKKKSSAELDALRQELENPASEKPSPVNIDGLSLSSLHKEIDGTPDQAPPVDSNDKSGMLSSLRDLRSSAGSTPVPKEQGSGNPLVSEFMDRTGRPAMAAVEGIPGAAMGLPGRLADATQKNLHESYAMSKQGSEEMRAGNILPTYSPANGASAGGLLKYAGGALGMMFSPVAGVGDVVGDEAKKITGDPAFGAKANLLTQTIGPTAVQAGGALVGNKLASGLRGLTPTGRAENLAREAMMASPEATSSATSALKNNPRMALVDTDPNLQNLAQGLTAHNGQARKTLTDGLTERASGQRGAINSAVDGSAGGAVDTVKLVDSMKETAKVNAERNFGAALTGAAPVDASPVIGKIDGMLKSLPLQSPERTELLRWRNELISTPGTEGAAATRVPKVDVKTGRVIGYESTPATAGTAEALHSDAEYLHRLQSRMNERAESLSSSATGSERTIGARVGDVRKAIVDQIDGIAAGKYKPAQAQYRADMQSIDSFNEGLGILRNRTGEAGLADRPEAWAKRMKEAPPQEADAIRKGVRVAMDDAINGLRRPLAGGEKIADIPFNYEKVAAVLGKKEADAIAEAIRDERKMANTNNRVIGNSKTAETQEAARRVSIREAGSGGNMIPVMGAIEAGRQTSNPLYGLMAYGGIKGGSAAFNAAARVSDTARNNRLAEILMQQGDQGAATLDRIMRPYAPIPTGGNMLLRPPTNIPSEQNPLNNKRSAN